MKVLTLLTSILLLGACAYTPTIKSVAGTYELKKDGFTIRLFLLENGAEQIYLNDKKVDEGKWIISKAGEIHLIDERAIDAAFNTITAVFVCSINPDGSLTTLEEIVDGKRTDIPKEAQITYKKIK